MQSENWNPHMLSTCKKRDRIGGYASAFCPQKCLVQGVPTFFPSKIGSKDLRGKVSGPLYFTSMVAVIECKF